MPTPQLTFPRPKQLIENDILISKIEAAERCGLTTKQFDALVKERIFPAPQSRGRWNRKKLNIALDILKCATDRVEPGYIYFMEMGDFIKIGWSQGPHVRREHLQIACPYDIKILGAFPGSIENEGSLHRMFRHALKRGEWFHKSPGLLAFIAWLKIAWRGNANIIKGDHDNVVELPLNPRGKSVDLLRKVTNSSK